MFKHLKKIWRRYKTRWVDRQAFKDLINNIKDIFMPKKP